MIKVNVCICIYMRWTFIQVMSVCVTSTLTQIICQHYYTSHCKARVVLSVFCLGRAKEEKPTKSSSFYNSPMPCGPKQDQKTQAHGSDRQLDRESVHLKRDDDIPTFTQAQVRSAVLVYFKMVAGHQCGLDSQTENHHLKILQ